MTIRLYSVVSVIFLLCAAIQIVSIQSATGEILYLRDGSVLKGSIVEEGKTGITVRSGKGELQIQHRDIQRILYGNMDMEKVYILTMGGNIMKGFLVDQDDDKVIFREQKFSPVEKIILKNSIREISRDEIYPVDLEVFMKPSGFVPVNSGGAELSPAVLYTFGLGFNSMIAMKLRFMLEAGYMRSESSIHNGQYLQVIPITLSLTYRIGSSKLGVFPKVGAGVGIMEYNTGEGEVLKTNAFEFLAGAGMLYEITRHTLYIGLWGEYVILYDRSDIFQGAIIGVSCGYRL